MKSSMITECGHSSFLEAYWLLIWFKKFVRIHLNFAVEQPNYDVNQTHDEDDVIRDIPRRYILGLKKRDIIKRTDIVKK